ncbi:hypothetical protein CRUP_010790 [Coryphaenoides rupestris]|nr:hypothetical protein CRUP_010790 [Coryphaenoides rupestris]
MRVNHLHHLHHHHHHHHHLYPPYGLFYGFVFFSSRGVEGRLVTSPSHKCEVHRMNGCV